MAILDKILNREPEERQREQLQRRLQQLPSLDQSSLEAIVASDEDKTLRTEALLLLNYGEPLISWAFGEEVGFGRAARQRLADLVDQNQVDVSVLVERLSLQQRLMVAGLINNDTKVESLLVDINDQDKLANLAGNHESARVRQWAAEKITDESAQQALLKSSKGKDKNVYKLMKERLEKQHQAERLEQQQREKIADLIGAIAKHSQAAVDPLYEAKCQHLQQQWRGVLQLADDNEKSTVENYFQQCQKAIDEEFTKKSVEPEAEEASDTESVSTDNAVDIDQINHQRLELLEGLKKVLTVLFEEPDGFDKSHTELNCNNIDNLWQNLVKQAPISDEAKEQYQQLTTVISYEVKNIEKYGSLTKHYDSLTAAKTDTDSHQLALQEKSIKHFKRRLQSGLLVSVKKVDIPALGQSFDQWLQERNERLEYQQGLLRQVVSLIRKSQGALKSGKTGPAQGIRTTLQEKCEKLEKLPRHIEKQLQELDEQLNKVLDWKEYAVLPKKRELVQQMQALVGASEPPEALATKIKRLQEEWKLLSRGGFNDDGDLWEQFRQAGDKAYEPCAEYFVEQAKIRADNIAKRQTLVQQLTDYNAQQNWEQADWKQVAKIVQTAFNEWHTYQPVERAANKAVQKKFEAVIADIRSQLDQEYQRNKEQKQSLVDQAAKLFEMEDNRTATEQAKQLQNRWKLIGSASHKADQALWKQFRKHCDAVFEKRKQITAEFKAELNDNKNKVLALCEELQRLREQELPGLLDSRDRVEAIQNEYRELGSLPKEKSNELQKRFREAVDSFAKSLRRAQTKAKAGAWDALLHAYGSARSVCMAIQQGDNNSIAETNLKSALENTDHWPKGGATALQRLVDEAKNGANVESDDQRRLLCIRAEILADLDSPKEDHQLRMDYQVKQLAKGFGQAQQQFSNAKEAITALLFEWITLQPTSTENYAVLLERINRCREKIGV